MVLPIARYTRDPKAMLRVPVDPQTIDSSRARVSGGDARHLIRVLRVKEGDAVIAFAGDGRAWDATVAEVGPTSVTIAIGAPRVEATESPCAITLGQGIGKGDKLDLVVRAATELGVAEIVPVATVRAVAEKSGADRLARWNKIAAEACKQCGRSRVPVVHAPESLAKFLERTRGAAVKVVPWEGGGAPLAAVARVPTSSAALLVGPEGGLEPREVEDAKAVGYLPVTLGPRILRTETAGIVAVAALQLLLGDLR